MFHSMSTQSGFFPSEFSIKSLKKPIVFTNDQGSVGSTSFVIVMKVKRINISISLRSKNSSQNSLISFIFFRQIQNFSAPPFNTMAVGSACLIVS